jgi:hypothetical protein
VRKVVLTLGIIYLVLYGTLLSVYHLPTPKTALVTYIAALQWAIPSMLLLIFVAFPKISAKLSFVFNTRFVTYACLSIIGVSVILQLLGVAGIWWSWDTMGLLAIIILSVVVFNKGRVNELHTVLLSFAVMFLGFGLFEIIYQIGILNFYDFFGVDHRNFWIVMMELSFWIFPTFITMIYLNSIYKKILYPNYYALVSIILAVIAGIIWFTQGFAIPVMWSGSVASLTHSSPLLIGISRYCQAFLTVGIALLFIPIKGWKLDKAIH